ncbi:MAG: hypothetical protein ABII27_04410 [bacterium]
MASTILRSIGGVSSSRLVPYGALKQGKFGCDLYRDRDKFSNKEQDRLGQFGIVFEDIPENQLTEGQARWDKTYTEMEQVPGKEVIFIASAVKDMEWIKDDKGEVAMKEASLDAETGVITAYVLALTNKGRRRLYKIQYNTKIHYLENEISREEARSQPQNELLASLYYDLGVAYGRLKEYDKAQNSLKHSLTLRGGYSKKCEAAMSHFAAMETLITGELKYFKETAEKQLTENLLELPVNELSAELLGVSLRLSQESRDPRLRTRELLIELLEFIGDAADKNKDFSKAAAYYSAAYTRDMDNDNLRQKVENAIAKEAKLEGDARFIVEQSQ